MGFWKKLFAPSEQTLHAKKVDDLKRAATSYFEATRRTDLEAKLRQFGDLDAPYRWTLSVAEVPEVEYKDISWDFGNFIQELQFLVPLHLQVPSDISQGMPANAKLDVVRAYWESVMASSTDNISRLLENWIEQSKLQVVDPVSEFDELHFMLLKFSLSYLNYYYFDMASTISKWNGKPGPSAERREISDRWLAIARDEGLEVNDLLHQLADIDPAYVSNFGFTNEMWEFLGSPEFAD